jgi:hypothetical protein
MSFLQLFSDQFAAAYLHSSHFRLPSLSPTILVTTRVAIIVGPKLSMATLVWDARTTRERDRRLSRKPAPCFCHSATSLHDNPNADRQQLRSLGPLLRVCCQDTSFAEVRRHPPYSTDQQFAYGSSKHGNGQDLQASLLLLAKDRMSRRLRAMRHHPDDDG